jgi:hypothetical protein
MRHGWLDPKRRAAKMAVGVYYFPGGFDGARLVRPATVELGDGRLVEIPLVLVDEDTDLAQMLKDLKAAYELVKRATPAMPPKRQWKKRGPRTKKKQK